MLGVSDASFAFPEYVDNIFSIAGGDRAGFPVSGEQPSRCFVVFAYLGSDLGVAEAVQRSCLDVGHTLMAIP